MEEIKKLLQENNQMLKEIKMWIDKQNSPETVMNREAANLLTNVIANLLVWKQNRM
jgi:hypothetical protein